MICRYEVRAYWDGELERRFRFFTKRSALWALRLGQLAGPRATFTVYDRWRRREIA